MTALIDERYAFDQPELERRLRLLALLVSRTRRTHREPGHLGSAIADS